MAVTHVVATRNAIADAVLAAIGASGFLLLYTAADAVEAARLPLSATAGVVGATDLVFNAITDDSSAVGGEVTSLVIATSAAVEIFRFLPADITMSSTTIAATDTVSCSALTYQPPA